MALFDDIKAQLTARQPLPPLYPTQPWQPALSQQIADASDAELFGDATGDPNLLAACRSGLLLWNDDLDASHRVSQGLENPTGSFWHAIMHRREGDHANSGYWWRNTGHHEAFADVYTEAMSVLINESDEQAKEFAAALQSAGTWSPLEFMKRSEQKRDGLIAGEWVERVQVAEMAALLDWCRRA